VGKTVESYRMALDHEVQRWNSFARALRKEDRKVFEQLIDICRKYASAGSNATRPVLFEPMVLSILLDQQKTLHRLKKDLIAVSKQSIKP
jgi:NADH:ubiquinone oxidoreductase subunit C